MARTLGAKGFKLKDLYQTAEKLKKRSEGSRPRWNKILVDTGYNLERLGRKLRRFEKEDSKTWSTWEYASFVHALRTCADVIEARAKSQEGYDEAVELLKES